MAALRCAAPPRGHEAEATNGGAIRARPRALFLASHPASESRLPSRRAGTRLPAAAPTLLTAMNEKQRVRTSKFLRLVLRHEPQRIGLELDPSGWVEVKHCSAPVVSTACRSRITNWK